MIQYISPRFRAWPTCRHRDRKGTLRSPRVLVTGQSGCRTCHSAVVEHGEALYVMYVCVRMYVSSVCMCGMCVCCVCKKGKCSGMYILPVCSHHVCIRMKHQRCTHMHVNTDLHKDLCMYVCMYVCMYECMYVGRKSQMSKRGEYSLNLCIFVRILVRYTYMHMFAIKFAYAAKEKPSSCLMWLTWIKSARVFAPLIKFTMSQRQIRIEFGLPSLSSCHSCWKGPCPPHSLKWVMWITCLQLSVFPCLYNQRTILNKSRKYTYVCVHWCMCTHVNMYVYDIKDRLLTSSTKCMRSSSPTRSHTNLTISRLPDTLAAMTALMPPPPCKSYIPEY